MPNHKKILPRLVFAALALLLFSFSCGCNTGATRTPAGLVSGIESTAKIADGTLTITTTVYEKGRVTATANVEYPLVVIGGKMYVIHEGKLYPVIAGEIPNSHSVVSIPGLGFNNNIRVTGSWPAGFILDSNQSDSSSYPQGTAVQGSWPSGFSQESNKSDGSSSYESAPGYN